MSQETCPDCKTRLKEKPSSLYEAKLVCPDCSFGTYDRSNIHTDKFPSKAKRAGYTRRQMKDRFEHLAMSCE